MKILPIIFALITAVTPVVTQRTGLSKKYSLPLKMLCVMLYLITGVLSALSLGSITPYTAMILAALSLGAFGDFFLEYKAKKLFPVGAVFFALGHIVYSYTFLCVGEHRAFEQIGAVIGITLLLSALIFAYAKTKLQLKGKKALILIYAPVLIFAFACSLVRGITDVVAGNLIFGLCLASGGALFLASDIMIGVGKGGIKRPKFLHNAVSYTYFAAQALFALSIYFQ